MYVAPSRNLGITGRKECNGRNHSNSGCCITSLVLRDALLSSGQLLFLMSFVQLFHNPGAFELVIKR